SRARSPEPVSPPSRCTPAPWTPACRSTSSWRTASSAPEDDSRGTRSGRKAGKRSPTVRGPSWATASDRRSPSRAASCSASDVGTGGPEAGRSDGGLSASNVEGHASPTRVGADELRVLEPNRPETLLDRVVGGEAVDTRREITRRRGIAPMGEDQTSARLQDARDL